MVDEVLPGLVESDMSDTESLAGSDFSGEVEQESAPEVDIVHEEFRTNSGAIRAAFQGLDAVELPLMFNRRAPVMKNILHFLRGAFRNCLRLAMEEACQRDPVRCERRWKLFMLLPRMLLQRPPRGGNDSTRLGEASGQCFSDKPSRVLRTSPSLSGEGIVSKATISPVSSGRQALEGEALAPGTDTTLNMLEDPERRPRTPHH